MLTLSRKVGERILIEHSLGPIWLEVIEVRGDQVRLGFEAPKAVTINREEVYERKRQQWMEEGG